MVHLVNKSIAKLLPGYRKIVGGATTTEGVDLSKMLDLQNHYVQNLLKDFSAFDNRIDIDEDIPIDCEKWAKKVANSFHVGSSTTLVELLDELPHAIKSWDNHRREKDIRVANCPSRCSHVIDLYLSVLQ